MRTGILKYATGLTVVLASCAALAATTSGSGQIGSADQKTELLKSTYRNMNIPLIQCKVSDETRKQTLASGNSIPEELSLMADFEDAMLVMSQPNFKANAFVVQSNKQVGSDEKAFGAGSLLTGKVTMNQKTSVLVFTSDLIKYNHKYVNKNVITFDQKKATAEIVTVNTVNSTSSSAGKYNCTSFGE